MSIQPNRVIARIIEQVDRSDWPPLVSRVHPLSDGDEWLRLYQEPAHPRYATALHFWVHALREELRATGRRMDLVGAAGHALCRARGVADWAAELDRNASWALSEDRTELANRIASARDLQLHHMLDSSCRQSSVLDLRSVFVADFRGHGGGPSWRRQAGKPI